VGGKGRRGRSVKRHIFCLCGVLAGDGAGKVERVPSRERVR